MYLRSRLLSNSINPIGIPLSSHVLVKVTAAEEVAYSLARFLQNNMPRENWNHFDDLIIAKALQT